MHFCTFVIIPHDADPESAVEASLAPFDEDLDVEPYRDYLDADEIRRMAEHYGIPATDLPALRERLPDWRGREGGIDDRGLYVITTYNRDGRWDWHEIGGRWNRFIPGSHDNVISVPALLKKRRLSRCLPYYVVTPDGRWVEQPFTDAQREHDSPWFAQVRDSLAPYPDHKVVCVDIHS